MTPLNQDYLSIVKHKDTNSLLVVNCLKRCKNTSIKTNEYIFAFRENPTCEHATQYCKTA